MKFSLILFFLFYLDILSPDLEKKEEMPRAGTKLLTTTPTKTKPLSLPLSANKINSSNKSYKIERKLTPRTMNEIAAFQTPFKTTTFYLIFMIAVVVLEQKRNELFS